MATTIRPEGITNPPIDDLLDTAGSKYQLVIYAAKRARQINAYYSQLGEGLLEYTYARSVVKTRFKIPLRFTTFKRTKFSEKILTLLIKKLYGRRK